MKAPDVVGGSTGSMDLTRRPVAAAAVWRQPRVRRAVQRVMSADRQEWRAWGPHRYYPQTTAHGSTSTGRSTYATQQSIFLPHQSAKPCQRGRWRQQNVPGTLIRPLPAAACVRACSAAARSREVSLAEAFGPSCTVKAACGQLRPAQPREAARQELARPQSRPCPCSVYFGYFETERTASGRQARVERASAALDPVDRHCWTLLRSAVEDGEAEAG